MWTDPPSIGRVTLIQEFLNTYQRYIYIYIFFYLGFLPRPFTNHRTAREGGGYSFNSSLPLPPASQTLRHSPGDYCRELTSARSWQPNSNREPLVSERKSLTTKLHTPKLLFSTSPAYWSIKNTSFSPY